jgi:Mg-chelatase subunit ChlI
VIYACLAETIVLALEGRFEVFTIGRDTEWEKVKEIYKLGLKHGMKLAAISGVNGVYSDEDIARVVELAKKARRTWKGSPPAQPAKAVATTKPKRPARAAAKTLKSAPAAAGTAAKKAARPGAAKAGKSTRAVKPAAPAATRKARAAGARRKPAASGAASS